jgi:ParB family chromosome partitioning protein
MEQLETMKIALKDIHADAGFNCRGTITPADVADLANSIKADGLLQPVLVMRYSPEEVAKTGFPYKLLAGFRRLTAHKILQLDEIDCRIKEHMDEAHACVLNLAENLKRSDLTIIQEARAIKRLYDLGYTEHVVAAAVQKSRSWVQVRFMLLELPSEVQEEVASGLIPQSVIRELYTVMTTVSRARCLEEAKEYKKAKLEGKKPKIKKAADDNRKKQRNVVEIQEMIDAILTSQIGECLGTRLLAWANGILSDGEIFGSIEKEAELLGVHFVRPYNP